MAPTIHGSDTWPTPGPTSRAYCHSRGTGATSNGTHRAPGVRGAKTTGPSGVSSRLAIGTATRLCKGRGASRCALSYATPRPGAHVRSDGHVRLASLAHPSGHVRSGGFANLEVGGSHCSRGGSRAGRGGRKGRSGRRAKGSGGRTSVASLGSGARRSTSGTGATASGRPSGGPSRSRVATRAGRRGATHRASRSGSESRSLVRSQFITSQVSHPPNPSQTPIRVWSPNAVTNQRTVAGAHKARDHAGPWSAGAGWPRVGRELSWTILDVEALAMKTATVAAA